MNIVQVQNDLKDLSDQQLYQTMQGGAAPHYLVLGEMQRRKTMRQEAASKPQAQTSVAEEIMAPPQMQGIAANPAPNMQQFAKGGLTGYAKGASEMCYKNPETGQQECPSAKGDVRKAKLSTPTPPKEDNGLMELLKKIGKAESGKEETTQKFAEGGQPKSLEEMTDEELRELAQLHVESNNRQTDDEGNIITSPKGALGKWQVMPPTAREPGYGMRSIFDLAHSDLERTDENAAKLLADPVLNDMMGKEYKRGLTEMFGEEGALPAYNMGPGAYKKYLAGQQGMPQETQDYVAKTEKKVEELRQEAGKAPAKDGIAALKKDEEIPSRLLPSLDPAYKPTETAGIPEGGDEWGDDITDPGDPEKANAVVQWVQDNPVEAALLGLTFTPAGGLLLGGAKVASKALPRVWNTIKQAMGKKLPADAKSVSGSMKALGPRTAKGKPYKTKEYAETAAKDMANATGGKFRVAKEGEGFVVVPTAGNILANSGPALATAGGLGYLLGTQLPDSPDEEEVPVGTGEARKPKDEGVKQLMQSDGKEAKTPSAIDKLKEQGLEGYSVNQPGQAPAPSEGGVASVPTTTTTTTSQPTGTRGDYVDELRARLSKLDEKDNFNRALMMAGLGMMTSKRRDLLGAIGEGGIAGLTAMNAADRADQAAMLDLLEREQKVISGKSGGMDFGDMVAMMKLREDIRAEVAKRYADTSKTANAVGVIIDQLKKKPEYEGKSKAQLTELAERMYKKRLWDEVAESQDYAFFSKMPVM